MEDWRNNPVLKDISKEKLDILVNILDNSKGLSSKELIPYFLKQSTKATSEGITFSEDETELIISVLKTRMSKEDISKIETIKKLSKMITLKAKKNKKI